MIKNRLPQLQADYIFAIVRTPLDWSPEGIDDLPPAGHLISREYVASFQEAYEDLVRCNQLAMQRGLREWAIIHSPGGDL